MTTVVCVIGGVGWVGWVTTGRTTGAPTFVVACVVDSVVVFEPTKSFMLRVGAAWATPPNAAAAKNAAVTLRFLDDFMNYSPN